MSDVKMFDTGQQDCIIDGLFFKLTCHAFPESYDVFYDDKKVAYVRLRHGELKVANPDNTEIWWNTHDTDCHFPPDKQLKNEGLFDDENERLFYLTIIAKVIHKKLNNPNWQVWQENHFLNIGIN
ncbi:hypothetical protein [Moraxella bovis]|uniref:Uncharacterized protein n=1 Tax=Moraxella bovis TaxID=476 RepID=A0A1T0A6B9_MORBO|nr:hypothetical protein [Moraxella bovis]AWY21472.1 hypothetical protein DQF64_13835 [Moraxella bovis]OOR91129.1 hypothetical protein B0182_03645 [Moraxella bovis]UYZ75660.1 hypothetical protein LP093_13210 [Moraxella bovis]UYZ78398.1 hypothetical protein LP115_00590 [Moraxella bovis]UYZ81285.1 hypothetical protein LP113_00595 [Moraxella bovis]